MLWSTFNTKIYFASNLTARCLAVIYCCLFALTRHRNLPRERFLRTRPGETFFTLKYDNCFCAKAKASLPPWDIWRQAPLLGVIRWYFLLYERELFACRHAWKHLNYNFVPWRVTTRLLWHVAGGGQYFYRAGGAVCAVCLKAVIYFAIAINSISRRAGWFYQARYSSLLLL